MTPDPRDPSRLHVRRLSLKCLVAGDAFHAARVGARLADTMATNLPPALRSALDAVLPDTDPSVWLIRTLAVDLDVNVASDSHRLGQAAGVKLARTLAKVVGGSDEDDGNADPNVAHYPDGASFLAAFLADAADGRAAGNWRYRRFEGLALLPTSATLRSAICARPPVGLAALTRFASPALRKVINALSPHDARYILETVARDPGAASPDAAFAAAAAAHDSHLTARGEWHDTLLTFIAAARVDPTLPGPPLAKAARAVVRLRNIRATASNRAASIAAALVAGDRAGLYTAAPDDAEVLVPWLDCAPETVGQTVTRHPAPTESRPHTLVRSTPFGGALLLLPMTASMAYRQAIADWPPLAASPAPHVLTLAILSRCFGAERTPQVLADPLLAELTGVGRPLDPEELRAWPPTSDSGHLRSLLDILAPRHRRASPDDRRHLGPSDCSFDRIIAFLAFDLLTAFARRLPGFADSHLPYLCDQFLFSAASLEDEPARRVVRLDRPPLHIVLSLTGVTSGSYTLPWLDPRPIALFTRDQVVR